MTTRRATAALRTLLRKPEPIIVTGVTSTRAMYVDEDHQEAEVGITLEGGIKITLRMTPRLLRALIEQSTITYDVINPPLNRRSGAATWQGMDI